MLAPALCTGTIHLLLASRLIASAPGPAVVATFAPPPRLAGWWVLNRDLSDDPREKLRELRERSGGRGGWRGRGDGGGEGRRPPVGDEGPRGVPGGPRGPGTDGGRGALALAMKAPARFELTQDDTSLTFDYGEGHRMWLLTTGEKLTRNLEGVGYVELKAKWKRERLFVERKFDRGGKIVEQFYLSPDTSQLIVLVELELSRSGELKLRRAYDRLSAAHDP